MDHDTDKDPTRLLRYRDSIYASDLLVCAIAHFDVFTFLKDAPRTFEEICKGLGMKPRPADVLLSLLRSMGLVRAVGDGYGLTERSRAYLVSDSSESLVPYYASLQNRPQCLEFRDILRTDRPAGWSSKKEGSDWLESMQDEDFADAFTAAMDSRGAFLAGKLAEAVDLGRFHSLLDVAGGSGIYACCAAQVHPHIRAAVLEMPPVDRAARKSIHVKDMEDRVDVLSGDMFRRLPSGYDIHLYANVLHDWDEQSVRRLTEQSHRSLDRNGVMIVFDAHLNPEKNGPSAVAEYSCLLMHATRGRCYSTREIGEALQSAGFADIDVIEVAADRTAIIGRKP
jgi:acetylserotonin N-methyltransferase